MKLNYRQLVDKYVADTPPSELRLHNMVRRVQIILYNYVYFTLLICFIVEHNDQKSVRIFA